VKIQGTEVRKGEVGCVVGRGIAKIPIRLTTRGTKATLLSSLPLTKASGRKTKLRGLRRQEAPRIRYSLVA
jgi:hypothetical protein